MLIKTFFITTRQTWEWEPLDAIRRRGYDPKTLGKSLRHERFAAPAKARRATSASPACET
jgi:hypothetical protein